MVEVFFGINFFNKLILDVDRSRMCLQFYLVEVVVISCDEVVGVISSDVTVDGGKQEVQNVGHARRVPATNWSRYGHYQVSK